MIAYSVQSVRIAVDIGGTFTDFVVEGASARTTLKLLTTPDAPERAVLDGIDALIRRLDLDAVAITSVIHGTTLATNAVIERRGARVGFVTTSGFRDTLEMGYEDRYDQYDLLLDRTPPLVERSRRLTVTERVAADGAVLIPLDEDGVVEAARRLSTADIEAVAVGFLHSYRNPAHEQRAAAILAHHLPGVSICLSSDVSPEIREYERFSTVVANAYIRPLMATYLAAFQDGLRTRGIAAPLLLMQSNGGLCDVASAMRYPVRLMESGPAGGAVFASAIAAELDLPSTLLLDVGGTTAKLSFADAGRPQMARAMEVGRVARFRPGSGLPVRLPVVQLCEIGAGGGSLAAIDALGRLHVGPRSAGSVPGPVCYGRGGTMPTVTDANLLLGRLDPDRFADSTIPLDARSARNALQAHVATPLEMSVEAAAVGILAVMNENMANAAREHAIDVNRSLAGRVLIGIGGGAALHAADLAEALGIDVIVIPRDAGVGSAVGFLRARLAFERALSWPEALTGLDPDATRAVVDRLVQQTVDDVLATGLASRDAVRTSLTAQMRYVGQGSEVAVAVALADLASTDAASRLRSAFAAAYAALYGRTLGGPVEVLAWSARSETAIQDAAPPYRDDTVPACATGHTWRGDLATGAVLDGPAMVVDSATTIIVPAGWTATVLAGGHMALRRAAARTRGLAA